MLPSVTKLIIPTPIYFQGRDRKFWILRYDYLPDSCIWCWFYFSLKKLVVKRPVQPVSGVPANPPQPEESKRKQSSTPKSPSVIPDGKRKFSMAPKSPTIKSPVMQPKERKKSTPPEPSIGRRPVSIVLDPESLQLKGSIQQSFSDPIIQTVGNMTLSWFSIYEFTTSQQG